MDHMADLNALESINEIQKMFNKIIEYSQGYSTHVNTDEYFDNWKKNKYRNFADIFKNGLIRELGHIEFNLSPDQRNVAFNQFIDDVYYTMEKYDCINENIITFLDENDFKNFYNNTVGIDYRVRTEHTNNKIQNIKGMKLLKAFKYFISNKDCLYEIQSIASRVLQKDKIEGTLCLSIHPIDYLSLSENAHNWRSCHALDGEYRAGNISYMQDSSTIICYIKSDEKYILPNFPCDIEWNSKKWRMLLFVDQTQNLIMAGRQYPYEESTILPKIKDYLNDIFCVEFSPWTNYYLYDINMNMTMAQEGETSQINVPLKNKMMVVPGPRLMPLRDVVVDVDNPLHFNDLLQSSVYTEPYYLFKKDLNWFSGYSDYPTSSTVIPKIKIGHKCTCAICNKESVEHSESLLCPHCMIDENQANDSDSFDDCFLCGHRYVTEEGQEIYLNNGDVRYVCPDCAENACVRCSYCNSLVLRDDVNEDGVCMSCLDGLEEKKTNFTTIMSPVTFEFEATLDDAFINSDLFYKLCIPEEYRREQNG